MEYVTGTIGIDRHHRKGWHVAYFLTIQPEETPLPVGNGHDTTAKRTRISKAIFDIISTGQPCETGGGKDNVVRELKQLVDRIHVADIGIKNSNDPTLTRCPENGGGTFPPAIVGKNTINTIKSFKWQPVGIVSQIATDKTERHAVTIGGDKDRTYWTNPAFHSAHGACIHAYLCQTSKDLVTCFIATKAAEIDSVSTQ